MAFVVTQACIDVKDKSCMQVCPADCLFEGDRMMYINPDLCINCGACEPACPQEAILLDEELEGEDEQFISINEQFFTEQDLVGGGRKLGKISYDAPFVRNHPAQ